jgi:hypothetical protein
MAMESAFEPPPPPPSKSEREAFFETRLFEELAARERLNRDTDERSEEFISTVHDTICYDPGFTEFFTQTQRRIAELKTKLESIRANGVSKQDIEDAKPIVTSLVGLLRDQPESLQRQISSWELKTQALITTAIPAAIAAYERELLENRALRARLQELESNG